MSDTTTLPTSATNATTPALPRAWSRLFFWTGVITMLPGLQFLLPMQTLRLLGIDVGDAPAAMFYARHWALMALCVGALLVQVGRAGSRINAAARGVIVLAATVEKAGLVVLVALAWSDPALQGLHGAALFDGLCTLLYAIWLWRAAR